MFEGASLSDFSSIVTSYLLIMYCMQGKNRRKSKANPISELRTIALQGSGGGGRKVPCISCSFSQTSPSRPRWKSADVHPLVLRAMQCLRCTRPPCELGSIISGR